LPGWQPQAELRRRIEYLRAQLQAAGRPTDAVEVAPQLSVTIAATDAEAERRYSESGLVQHRQSLAYTGRDPRDQVRANLIGSPSTIRDRVADLEGIGVDHCCALWFSTTTVEEMLDQMEWFARDVIKGRGES
jgi:alkanesulfonate monooxygenase SsuD/methylene tetrahydromethanopterin reductase-like flavin-dependent oxidoreductase (luciferase family)